MENIWEKLTEEYQIEKLNFYCKNNMRELRKICDPIINQFMSQYGIPNMNRDDLYGVAVDTLADSISRYDEEKSKFTTFLTGNLKRKFLQWRRDSRRRCRCNIVKDEGGNDIVVPDLSFDTPSEDGFDLSEMIDSGFNVEMEYCLENEDSYHGKVKEYMNSLGEIQREIAELLYDGYDVSEVKEKLGLSDKEYALQIKNMRSYDKKKILIREEDMAKNSIEIIEEENMTMGTSEKTKDTSYSLDAISKKLRKHRLRDDHILQRTSGQWNTKTKSELMSDILQGRSLTQVIISEEIKNGIQMLWLIDGKQRCTNIDDFLHDGFAISKNIKIWNIEYQTDKIDENGNIVLNEDGFPIPEKRYFDIRGKKFSQLPDELQDKFKEYQLPVMFNLNCTKKDIAYDISRFNRCRPMNKAQNGWTGFDEEYAELVDNILKMDFFKPDCKKTKYTAANITAGALRRMIVESIMVSEFMDDYTTDFVRMCEYLTENATENVFVDFFLHIERLVSVMGEETADFFNTKNSFLWFVLFNKFDKLSIGDDTKFYDFMCALKSDLHSKEINGDTFDSLDEMNGTKKKNLILRKLNYLETLMKEFLGIECESNEENMYEDVEENTEEVSMLDFVKENVYENEEVTEDDINFYKQCLEDYTVEVDNNSPLLEEENYTSLVALVAHSFKEDKEIVEWLPDFFMRNNTYFKNQKENYTYMVNDLNKFLERTEAA